MIVPYWIHIVHIFPKNCIADTSDMYARCESQDSGIPSVVQSMISPSRLAGSIPITVSLNEHVYFGKKKKRTSVGNIRIFQLAKFPYFYCLNLPFLVGDPPCCNLSTSPGILFCWTQFNFYFFCQWWIMYPHWNLMFDTFPCTFCCQGTLHALVLLHFLLSWPREFWPFPVRKSSKRFSNMEVDFFL